MKKTLLKGCWVILAACLPVTATAQTVDGTLLGDETFYGSARSIQNTATQFGDAFNGDPRIANGGSEINQVFAAVAGGRLHVLITGNLESNFNKLEVFIDSEAGGVNVIDGAALPTMVDGHCCTIQQGWPDPNSGALQRMNGLTFDADFAADHYLTFSNGFEWQNSVGIGGARDFWAFTAHYANLTAGPAGQVTAIGMQLNASGQEPGLGSGVIVDQNNNGWDGPTDPFGSPPEHEFVEPVAADIDPTNFIYDHRNMANDIDLRMAINNSNTAGVEGSGGPDFQTFGDPQNVVTGIEFSIPLSVLGNPTGDILMTAFINGGGHDYASNQWSGVGILRGNPGGDGFGGYTGNLAGVNLNSYLGNQYVTIPSGGSGPSVDINGDGNVNGADVDALVEAIVNGGDPALFDLDGSGAIDGDDLTLWLADAATFNGLNSPYRLGDATLDGNVDVSDFNSWNGSKFTSVAAWSRGDFNADGSVDVSDFNLWNGNKFTSSNLAAVPEPAGWLWVAASLMACWARRGSDRGSSPRAVSGR